ncbi:MAG: GumC family protein, partial [Methylobacterium sp.]
MPRRSSTIDPSPHLPFAPPARDGLTLSQVGPRLRRGWAWILIPTLLVAIGAGAVVQAVPPRYTAEAGILLEGRDRTLPLDAQTMAREAQRAMSRDLARDAVRRLNLVGDPRSDAPVGEIGLLRSLLALAGLGGPAPGASPEDRALDGYFERLQVFPAGKPDILQVAFSAGDPDLAARAANTISELYLAALATAKADTARPVSTAPGADLDALRSRVAEAEARVASFRARTGRAGSGAGSSLGGQQLGELSSQLAQARTVKADLGGRVKLLKEMIRDGRAAEIPDIAGNDLMRRTVESRMSLRAQLALESRTLLPAHPRFKALTAQVDDLDQQIKAAAERVLRTLENDARTADARVDSLQATVQAQSDVVAKGNSNESQLRVLEREVKVQREQLESQLGRSREAGARDAASVLPTEARVVAPATAPERPAFPQQVPIVGFATALAFLLSTAAALRRRPRAAPNRSDRRTGLAGSEPAPSERPDLVAKRIDYPEPMPPEQHREPHSFGPAHAGFGGVVTANAAFPRLVAESDGSGIPVVAEPEPAIEPVAPPAETDVFGALIDRLGTVPGRGGRCVLVVETEDHVAGSDGLAAGLARSLSAFAATLMVDIGATATDHGDLGLTDVVAGEAAFLDVIQPLAGARHHVIRAGATDPAILLDEPHGLAIGLNAMAQAYDWVVCRLSGSDAATDDLLSALSACMDSVVI